ncbi:hypothetical protein B273_0614 [SAR86 cluster bacterium SAR86E]|uniref:Uncharacterized protein n=1 Tax=SAR86 cluster bacterium SAR86E TaxID=1208365 RepID=K6FBB4_9GAMM|nr:hypothetical protein B273_0614 [SAR86 cluster bacterium SAR86E]
MQKPIFLIDGLSGRFGNKFLQHIDALNYIADREGTIVSNDIDCRRFLKNTSKKFDFKLKQKWQLSEVLFHEKPIDIPSYFITAESLFEKPANYIALHFRGTDFSQWKKHSIIKEDFFIDSIPSDYTDTIFLVTDDSHHSIVQAIVETLVSRGLKILLVSGNPFSDFIMLMRAKKIIASPSTFSLAAAILGSKKIIYPQKYAAIEGKNGNLFWAKNLNNEETNYAAIELL